MNKFKNKWIFIIAILVIILGIFIYSNKDDIIKLVGINNKNVYDSNTDQSYWASDVCYKKDPFINAYEYNDSVSEGEKGYCISGKEDTCLESKCYKDKSVGSCSAGTIIHYFVNETEDYYFNVLHDDGDTMTLIMQSNIGSSAWGNSISEGPVTALTFLTEATKDWNNVNNLTYTLGKTIFIKYPNVSNNDNFYTSCSAPDNCTTNLYTLSSDLTTNVKARMLSVQEAYDLGCTGDSISCPIWLLFNPNAGLEVYWLSNSAGESSSLAWATGTYAGWHYITTSGSVYGYHNYISQSYGVRAVIEITK
jgi:hypothetical protein